MTRRSLFSLLPAAACAQQSRPVLDLPQFEPRSTLHVAETVTERVFGDWAMLHDPAATWFWTQQQVANGAAERATPDEVTAFFLRLRRTAD